MQRRCREMEIIAQIDDFKLKLNKNKRPLALVTKQNIRFCLQL